jgi:rod shape-determining protein MreC
MVSVLAIVLIVMDARNVQWVKPVKSTLVTVLEPIQTLAKVPSAFAGWVGNLFAARGKVAERVLKLQEENLVLKSKLQMMSRLKSENASLQSLVNAKAQLSANVKVAEIVSVLSDPFRHEVMINRGKRDGVYEGQAVLDATGLFGQVVEVLGKQSKVLLISDKTHALPVMIDRNGIRAIVVGVGKFDALSLLYLPNTTDMKEGDLLLSSGLGGRFPVGYPVARVDKFQIHSNSLL